MYLKAETTKKRVHLSYEQSLRGTLVQCKFLPYILFDLVYLNVANNAQRVHLWAELNAAYFILQPLCFS